jgi:hypothetical protein
MITSRRRDGLVTLRGTRSRNNQHYATEVIGRRRPSTDDQ